MRLAAALLGAVLAVPSAAEWPWQTTRYYADSGDKADDVSFAGLPLGTGYKTDGLTSCSCDLTADVCDPYCCCDAACSSTERNSLFDCEADANVTFTRAGVYTCADATAVVQANLPDTAKAAWEVDAENPLNRVLCVVGDNSASYGNFIAPLEPLSDSELADYSVAANSSFAGKLAGGTPNPYTNSYYSPGQALNQGTSSGEGASASEYAPVLLPSVLAGGASGGCADFAPIRFLESFSPRSCVTYAALGLSTICSAGSTLDASLFSGLSLGASGLIPGSSDYEKVSVEVASLYFQELGSNERTELDASTVPMPQVNSSVTNSR
ncbi:hypothetical protein T492DRAFT_460644 [Pavlovales sp. CCMP2436]|nr:hypothetical protein T492DRAFT_460644 [Pavlovales sp. CCMP2436]